MPFRVRASVVPASAISLCILASPPRAALPAGPCDYLVVSDSLLLPQARRLADMRHRLTPAIAAHPCVAAMGDVYRAHPPAGLRWTSLRDYLAARHRAAPGEIRHVVLFGSAAWNDGSEANRVPVFNQRIPSFTQSDPVEPRYDTLSSDDAFTLFFDSVGANGGGPQLPDSAGPAFAIGRIPASTPEQAEAYLDKVEAYESAYPYGPQAFTYGYASDDDLQPGMPDGQDRILFMPEFHSGLWEYLKVKPFVRRALSIEFPIQPDGTKPGARDSLIGLMAAGAARVLFIGHGGPSLLTDESMFKMPGDLARLRRPRLPPVFAALSGGTARFANPEATVGTGLLFHPFGAIAFLGATIPTFPDPNLYFGKAFDSAAALGATVGGAVMAAKRGEPGQPGWRFMNRVSYVLLGDPGLSLPAPAFDLAPAPGSGPGRLVLDGPGAAGDSAYFQLVRIDSVPWNAVIAPANEVQRDRAYVRETVVAEGRGALGPGGRIEFALPPSGKPSAASVKAMTWNPKGMKYGHFRLDSLGTLALRPRSAARRAAPAVRMRVRGNELILERNGRGFGLDGRLRPGTAPARGAAVTGPDSRP